MALVNSSNLENREIGTIKILIVDDEPAILDALYSKMRREKFSTFTAESAEDGIRLFRKVKPDLVIVDIMLPQRSGFDLCKSIRKESSIPVIFISAKADEQARVAGLEMGADDYVTKPFNMNELVARVRAVLRRSSGDSSTELIERGNLFIDPKSHEAKLNGKAMELSPREFALLYFLAKNAGQVFSREVLIDRVWGKDAYVSLRTVDVHIRWLRAKIEAHPENPERLVTFRGVGYKFAG